MAGRPAHLHEQVAGLASLRSREWVDGLRKLKHAAVGRGRGVRLALAVTGRSRWQTWTRGSDMAAPCACGCHLACHRVGAAEFGTPISRHATTRIRDAG